MLLCVCVCVCLYSGHLTHRRAPEYMSIIVQQDATIHSFIIFLQKALQVWMIHSPIIRSTFKL